MHVRFRSDVLLASMASCTFDASSSETHVFQTALCSFRYLNAPAPGFMPTRPNLTIPAILENSSPGRVAPPRKLTRSGARSGIVGCMAMRTVSLSASGLPPSVTVPFSTTELIHAAVSSSAVSTWSTRSTSPFSIASR